MLKIFVSLLLLVTPIPFNFLISPVVEIEQGAASQEYVCPPCGCGKDDQIYDKPGSCPVCGMQLVLKSAVAANNASPTIPGARKKAAILIFDGVQIIDYSGPYEVFGQAGFDVFTVAVKPDLLTTAMGQKVTPRYTLDDAPAADVLIIPGGNVTATQEDPQVMKWIQERSKQAEYVLSVCNGAYILAKTGLLDGLTATTFYGLIDGLPVVAPKVKVVKDRRYVDNGKYITTAGLSSGIDGSLYLISKMLGKGRAQMVALNMEYDWKADSTYARASFADRHIRSLFGTGLQLPRPSGTEFKVLSTEGSTRNWEVKWQVQGETSAADVLKALDEKLAASQWTKQHAASRNAAKSVWKFSDEDGSAWSGVAEVQPAGDKVFTVSLKVERNETASTSASTQTAHKSSAAEEKFVIHNAWVQEMPPSSRISAAYLVVENRSGKETALIAAKSDIAETTEVHQMAMVDGMMKMQKVDRVKLPVGKTELTGDFHIMLIGLKSPVKEGDQVKLTLQFENAVSKTITVPVKKRTAQ